MIVKDVGFILIKNDSWYNNYNQRCILVPTIFHI